MIGHQLLVSFFKGLLLLLLVGELLQPFFLSHQLEYTFLFYLRFLVLVLYYRPLLFDLLGLILLLLDFHLLLPELHLPLLLG